MSLALLAAAPALLAGCGGDGRRVVVEPDPCTATLTIVAASPAVVPAQSPYDAHFASAGAEFGVPPSLLRAIAYVETGWEMVRGEVEHEGRPAAHGVMALRGDRLREGARLAGLPEESVRRDPGSNIRAAAALLRALADAERGDWDRAVVRHAGIAHPDGQASYLREVTAVRAGRRTAPEQSAPTPLAARSCEPPPPPPPPVTDQPGAAWRPSPNFNARMAGVGGTIHMVIIHSCEGAYIGCWSWLADAASQVSAHYVVREDGAEITQLVREPSRAWHIGATYDSTLNAGHDGGLHGVQSNHFTIGVEHAGYASQATWPDAQLEASARLVCDLTKRWQIPRDQLHIVSHGQLQPYNRTDPGRNWPWADYLARIDRYCAS